MRISRHPLSPRFWPFVTVLGGIALGALLAGCDDLLVRDPGEKLWRRHCASCHGLDAAGNTAQSMGEVYADLRDDSWNSGGGDRYSIESVIRNGVFGKMPANDKLSKQEMDLLVRHLYKLRGETPQ